VTPNPGESCGLLLQYWLREWYTRVSYRTSTLCLPLEFVLKTLEEKLSAARGINKYDRDNAKKAKTVIYRLTKKELHLLGLASLKCSRVLKSRGALQ